MSKTKVKELVIEFSWREDVEPPKFQLRATFNDIHNIYWWVDEPLEQSYNEMLKQSLSDLLEDFLANLSYEDYKCIVNSLNLHELWEKGV